MRKALITGGSSGIGRAIALKLADLGSSVYITGRDSERLQFVASEIEKRKGTAYFSIADVRDPDQATLIVNEAIDKMGSIDVLVANAGVGYFKPLEEFTDEEFDVQFETNVKGVFNYIRPVVKHMKDQNTGQIVVTSSNLGFETGARCGIYAATKFALQGMVGALRDELEGTGVKAGTINPGSVDTPWFDGKDVDRSKMLDPKDVAEAAMLLIQQGNRSDIDHILLKPGVQ